jgi:hypothetical protein
MVDMGTIPIRRTAYKMLVGKHQSKGPDGEDFEYWRITLRQTSRKVGEHVNFAERTADKMQGKYSVNTVM